jgi:hypothetical protein
MRSYSNFLSYGVSAFRRTVHPVRLKPDTAYLCK